MRRLRLRHLLLFSPTLVAYACNQAWDDYDPRLGSTSNASASASASSSAASSSSGSSSGSASSSSGGACEPGAMMPCYDGPAGTAGVGNCKPGVTTCGFDGGWGGCQGATLPQVESCVVAGDFDCNGAPNDHCADWSFVFGSTAPTSSNQVYAVAINDGGGPVIVGTARPGQVSFFGFDGGPEVTSGGVFVAELADAGDPSTLALTSFGGGFATATAVGLDPSGDVTLACGVYTVGAVTIGQTKIVNPSKNSGFILGLAELTGTSAAWVTDLTTTNPTDAVNIWANGVAVDSTKAYVAGAFSGDVQLINGIDAGGDASVGAEILTSDAGTSGLLMRVDRATGSYDWGTTIGARSVIAYTVALDDPYVFVGGSFADSPMKIGDLSLPGSPTANLLTGFVLRFNTMGVVQYGASFAATSGTNEGKVFVDSLAILQGSEIVAVGRFSGDVQFGPSYQVSDGGAVGAPCAASTQNPADLFIAILAPDLSCKQLLTIPSTIGFASPAAPAVSLRGQGFGPQVAVDGLGHIHVVANFSDEVDAGGTVVNANDVPSILLLELEPVGSQWAIHWVRQYLTTQGAGAWATGIGADGAGNVYVVGQLGASGITSSVQFQVDHALLWESSYASQGMFVARIAH